MKLQNTVLIIEDDESIGRLLQTSLHQNDYKTIWVKDRQNALREVQTRSFDLILIDLGLPDGDGKELIRQIRLDLTTPLIVVSARFDEKEIIASLDQGADDYVTKPFSINQLLARIRSAQRRVLSHQTSDTLLICDQLQLDTEQFVLLKEGQTIKLTQTEFNLLKYLMLHPNQVLPHAKILKEVWGIAYEHEMQYLRTYINSLRKKIETKTTSPQYIQTELGIGYRFNCSQF